MWLNFFYRYRTLICSALSKALCQPKDPKELAVHGTDNY